MQSALMISIALLHTLISQGDPVTDKISSAPGCGTRKGDRCACQNVLDMFFLLRRHVTSPNCAVAEQNACFIRLVQIAPKQRES